jgi:copper chaperone
MTPPWRLPKKIHVLTLRLTQSRDHDMVTLNVEKVKCGGCAANLKQAVLAKDPQAEIQVHIPNKQVTIDSQLDNQALVTLISQAGYPASLQT